MLKNAIERANKLVGGWPEDEAIIGQLEGLGMDTPSGYLYIRPDNHQGYKDAVTGFSKNNPEYPFLTWDPDRIITIPIRNITAPANWPKPGNGHNESTAAAELDQDDLAESRRLSLFRPIPDCDTNARARHPAGAVGFCLNPCYRSPAACRIATDRLDPEPYVAKEGPRQWQY